MITSLVFDCMFLIMGLIVSYQLGNMVDKTAGSISRWIGMAYTLIFIPVASAAVIIITGSYGWSVLASFIALLVSLFFTRFFATLCARAYSYSIMHLI